MRKKKQYKYMNYENIKRLYNKYLVDDGYHTASIKVDIENHPDAICPPLNEKYVYIWIIKEPESTDLYVQMSKLYQFFRPMTSSNGSPIVCLTENGEAFVTKNDKYSTNGLKYSIEDIETLLELIPDRLVIL